MGAESEAVMESALRGEFGQPHLNTWFSANTPSTSIFHSFNSKCPMEDTKQSYPEGFLHVKEYPN